MNTLQLGIWLLTLIAGLLFAGYKWVIGSVVLWPLLVLLWLAWGIYLYRHRKPSRRELQ